MDRDNFPAKVAKMMETIEKTVVSNPEESEKACGELEQYAFDNRDEYLKGYCLFFRGFPHRKR